MINNRISIHNLTKSERDFQSLFSAESCGFASMSWGLLLIMSDTTGMMPIELNTILATQDPLALDCIAARITGLDPNNISYLKHAIERGIGESDYSRIQIQGTLLDVIIKTWDTQLAGRHSTSL